MKELVLKNYFSNNYIKKRYSNEGVNENYNTGIDLDNLEDIAVIWINVEAGDEVANVVYTNGDIKVFDSWYDAGYDGTRVGASLDYTYPLYIKDVTNNIDEFMKREDSDWCPKVGKSA